MINNEELNTQLAVIGAGHAGIEAALAAASGRTDMPGRPPV